MKIVKAENVIQVNEAVCEELKKRLSETYQKSFDELTNTLQSKVGTKTYNDKYCSDFIKCCKTPMTIMFGSFEKVVNEMAVNHGIAYHDAMELILEFMYDRLQEAKEAQVTLDNFKDDEQVGFA